MDNVVKIEQFRKKSSNELTEKDGSLVTQPTITDESLLLKKLLQNMRMISEVLHDQIDGRLKFLTESLNQSLEVLEQKLGRSKNN